VTDENRRRNLQDELARAADALLAAQALLDLGLHADSVSRSYYAVFHYLRALLLTRGIEPKSHNGAIRLFNTEFVRPGAFPTAHNRLLGGLQKAREMADYDSAVAFSKDDARAQLEEARQFAREVGAFLEREGWTPAQTPER
jgi:uncharacterized protein (UPF0332 family)